uniref:Uncharacterized protein n=1 Tax=Romanomermis culicivorax TaxID=13658 RepID=A0A915K4V0_ROMCU
MRVSFEMAKQAKGEATVARNVKGTLDEIRGKLKPVRKSNLVDMNLDDYCEDPPAELYDDQYLRQYEAEMAN